MSWYMYSSLAVSVLAVAGNGFVAWLIMTRSALHNTTNWFILSLSLSDLLVGSLIATTDAACYKLNTCDIYLKSAFQELFLYESVFNLCAMTMDRYIAILHPLKYPLYMTTVGAFRTIAISWAIPIVNFGLHFAWLYAGPASREKGYRIFTILEAIFMVFIPSLMLLVANAQIVEVARLQAERTKVQLQGINFNKMDGTLASSSMQGKHLQMEPLDYNSKKKQKDVSQENSLSEMTAAAVKIRKTLRKRPKRGRLQRSTIKVVIVVVAMFWICWSVSLYVSFCKYLGLCKVSLTVRSLSWMFMIFNSAINPVVFLLFKNDIRTASKAISICKI